MGHITEISKTKCDYCDKIISRNGLGYNSHMRKHVREGIALEINRGHFLYRGVNEYLNLRYPAKVGTIPKIILLDKYSFPIKLNKKIKFRYEDGNKWLTGIVDDINDNCIFIDLL